MKESVLFFDTLSCADQLQLRFEASESLKLLKEETSDKFQPLFIARADVEIQKYDILLRLAHNVPPKWGGY